MDVALELSLYIERFHNLDLWQQGWYALKVTCNWEGAEQETGVPSRVVQYEGASDGLSTVWHINDSDHSFCTRPFKIKYARQDVALAVMVSFSLPIKSVEAIYRSYAVFNFQLLFAPLDGFLFFNSMNLELPAVANHPYRLSPKAVHGVHSYCPLHFDSSHMALVDVYVHTVVLSISHHEVPFRTETNGGLQDKDEDIEKVLVGSKTLLLEQLKAFGYREDELEQFEKKMLEKGSVISSFQEHKALDMQLSSLWNLFLKLHRKNKDFICKRLRDCWIQRKYTQCSMWVHQSEISDNVSKTEMDDKWAVLRAEVHRKSLQSSMGTSELEDMHLYSKPLQQPIIFVEQEQIVNNVDEGDANDNAEMMDELRFVIFVHGFQGHHLDLRLIRNHWILADPDAEVLMSQANEERTSGDLSELGRRLADEVSVYLRHKMSKAAKHGTYNYKISFVGHSIGNLIIRAALTEASLQPYIKYLYTFLSISGPHLGYMYSSNSLFNSGLWLMKKWKGSTCMHQLTFTDKPNIEDCYLFKLSQAKTLEHFQHVLLLSSPQDRYVPYHSARIEMCQAALRDTKRGSAYAVMLHNCLVQLKSGRRRKSLIRCDVNFDISAQARSFNSLIGRTAHIEFLETDAFIRFIMWTFPKCFL